MQWLRLDIKLLPCIAMEVDNICIYYNSNHNTIMNSIIHYSIVHLFKFRVVIVYLLLRIEILSAINNGEKSQMKDYTLLRAAIQARIEELEEFYSNNCTDVRIHHFEKLRLKLKKLLMNQISFQNDNSFNFISPQKSKLSAKASTHPNNSPFITHNDRHTLANAILDLAREEIKKKRKKKAVRDLKNTLSYKNMSGQRTDIPFTGNSKYSSKSPIRTQSPAKMGNEIIFKLKLTPSEYQLYKQRQQQKANILQM